jgi:hypothetical protein
MKHSVPHDLDQELAKKATVAAFDAYKARYGQYNPTAEWVTDNKANISFGVKGITLKGALEVTPKSVDMELDVPLVLKPFKKKAMQVIEEEITKWVKKAKAGEL